MKNLFLILAAFGLVAITVSFVPAVSKSVKSIGSKQLTTSAIPDDVKAIFEKSCTGCHSDDGKGLAKSKVNFSKWDAYEPAKQAAKGADICKMVTKGKMPPKGVQKSKPELKLTQDQINLVCQWSKTLGK